MLPLKHLSRVRLWNLVTNLANYNCDFTNYLQIYNYKPKAHIYQCRCSTCQM